MAGLSTAQHRTAPHSTAPHRARSAARPAVRRSLEAIAATKPGVLIHGAAGRDRTGMVSALLLANAGVSGDDIVADYAESVHAMAGAAPHGGPPHDRQASWTPEELTIWLNGGDTARVCLRSRGRCHTGCTRYQRRNLTQIAPIAHRLTIDDDSDRRLMCRPLRNRAPGKASYPMLLRQTGL